MTGEDKFRRFHERYPYPHKWFFERPMRGRRDFLRMAGVGLGMSFLWPKGGTAADIRSQPVRPINRARNVIFILLAGAPSHIDTFDLKMVNGVTPATFNPAAVSGIQWPTGIMPKLGQQLGDIAIVRSMRSWALVHSLAQIWTQIGRNPAAALGDIAPNIGSIVTIEKEPERRPGQVFPTFVALNSQSAVGSGYLPAANAPFKVAAQRTGLANTTNADGQTRNDARYTLLRTVDDSLRTASPMGRAVEDYDTFYKAARGLMYNPVVNQAFGFTTEESARYGNTNFGNCCLIAKQILQANQGTRYIQITEGGWDMHNDIYAANQLPAKTRLLDDGVAALLGDLKSTGLLAETMVVMAGEFGRTVGALSAAQGRDHFAQQFCMFAGAGIRGGRAIGSTNASGNATVDYGWSRQRDIRPEDVEATIYSAMGINWTSVRYDDPFGRGFEYVPFADDDVYGPINELWGS